MTANLITLENITLIKQDKEIIKEYSLHINQKQKINIYGDNGSGNFSLFCIFESFLSLRILLI